MKRLERLSPPAPILLVDDDELFLEYLQTLLEGFGYNNTDTAGTGQEGLSKVEKGE